ncbi:phosphatase PAP2 family protein [Cellulomonas aerilata]|uniref:Putative phosphoesterase n=1 Tax=Cellulomonas aerilata TaxID=515326 RepID=A0A512D8M9_9CELL|nr:phosphatase PAP2 family protein [Cellulomonas aerilata]GEO32811.1 putative phosphoesterase [Cellulomonas aerilata]
MPHTTADLRVLLAVQRALGGPRALAGARVLGAAGEHAVAWVTAGAVGALVDRPRRHEWLRGTGVVVVAHGAGILLKRLTRRARPQHADLRVVPGLGRWGMPSSHAASTTAAALVFGGLLRTRTTLVLLPLMGVSRLVVGAHYPTDVLAGTVLGAVTATAARRWTS